MERAERDVPLHMGSEDEAGASPIEDEGRAREGGAAARRVLDEQGDAWEGGCGPEVPGVWAPEGGEAGVEFPAGANGERGGPLQHASRLLSLPTGDALVELCGGEAHDGDGAAAVLGSFGSGPVPWTFASGWIGSRVCVSKTTGGGRIWRNVRGVVGSSRTKSHGWMLRTRE
jgi:hypothetical protein